MSGKTGKKEEITPGPLFVKYGEFWNLNMKRCPDGYALVLDYFRNRPGKTSMALELEGEGVYVKEHCRLLPKR